MANFFHLFSSLPVEIRLLIWEFAIPDARIVYVEEVEVKQHNLGQLSHNYHEAHERLWSFKPYCPAPALLFINEESISVARKHYQLAFSCENESNIDCSEAGSAQTWFDFERDILYLSPSSFSDKWSPVGTGRGLNDMPDSDLRQVKHLALATSWNAGEEDYAMEAWVAEILGVLGGVENLYIITDHSYDYTIEVGYDIAALCDLRFVDTPGEEQICVEDAIKKYTKVQEMTRHPPLRPSSPPLWELEVHGIRESILEEKRTEWNGILDAARAKEEALVNDDNIHDYEETISTGEEEDPVPVGLLGKNTEKLQPRKQDPEISSGGKLKTPFLTSMDLHSKYCHYYYTHNDESQPSFDAQWFVDMLNFMPSREHKSLPSRVYNFEMPKIEHRVVLSAGLKKVLDTARRDFYATIDRNIDEHKLHEKVDCQCGWAFNAHIGKAQHEDEYWAYLAATRGSEAVRTDDEFWDYIAASRGKEFATTCRAASNI